MNLQGKWLAAGITIVLSLVMCGSARAQDKEQSQLAKAMQGVSVSLEQGLSAAGVSGTPISGKFELDNGKLQLSVYTMKGNQFSEVIVDHKSSQVAKTEAITDRDDVTAAKAQSSAMARAKQSLRAVTERAVKANSGFRAVSVVPSLENGKPVAKVLLLRGDTFKTVSEVLE